MISMPGVIGVEPVAMSSVLVFASPRALEISRGTTEEFAFVSVDEVSDEAEEGGYGTDDWGKFCA